MAAQQSSNRRLLPVVRSPSRLELSNAERIIGRWGKSPKVYMREIDIPGFVINDDSVRELLRRAPCIPMVGRDATHKVREMFEVMQYSEETFEEFIEFKGDQTRVLLEVVAASRRSKAAVNAMDIAVRFAVVKITKSDPWYSEIPILGWMLDGHGTSPVDATELKGAMETICRSELAASYR